MLRRRFMSVVSTLVVVLLAGSPVAGRAAGLSEKEALELGVEAYIYGYPLVTMEIHAARDDQRREPEGHPCADGPVRSCATYPDASFKDVTAPNADTLYTIAWLDVAKEPYVLSLPDAGDRYLPVPDARRLDRRVPGARQADDRYRAQTYAITGPGWKGTLPAGVKEYKSPTEHGLDPRPHLLHRHAGGLRGGARAAGHSTRSCRSAPTASRTRRPSARSIRAST